MRIENTKERTPIQYRAALKRAEEVERAFDRLATQLDNTNSIFYHFEDDLKEVRDTIRRIRAELQYLQDRIVWRALKDGHLAWKEGDKVQLIGKMELIDEEWDLNLDAFHKMMDRLGVPKKLLQGDNDG